MTRKEGRIFNEAVAKNNVTSAVFGYMQFLIDNKIFSDQEVLLSVVGRLEEKLQSNPLSKATQYFINQYSDYPKGEK